MMHSLKRRIQKMKTWQIVSVIVLFGLLLRVLFFSGMGISDSLAYSSAANDLREGKGIDEKSVLTLSTRIGITATTALSYSLFGVNDLSAIAFALLASLGGIILVFLFGKLLFDERLGLLAAFLLAIFPFDVVYATQLNSDIPSAFFMALGVYLFLYAERKEANPSVLCTLCGVLIGIGYLIRESALLIALFFITYILYQRRLRLRYLLVPLGVLLVLVLEALVFNQLTGDPLYRTHASQHYLAVAVAEHDFFGRLDFPTGLLHYP